MIRGKEIGKMGGESATVYVFVLATRLEIKKKCDVLYQEPYTQFCSNLGAALRIGGLYGKNVNSMDIR